MHINLKYATKGNPKLQLMSPFVNKLVAYAGPKIWNA